MSVIESILICMTFQDSSKVMSTRLKYTLLCFWCLGKSELIRHLMSSYTAGFLFSLIAGFCVSMAGPDGLLPVSFIK